MCMGWTSQEHISLWFTVPLRKRRLVYREWALVQQSCGHSQGEGTVAFFQRGWVNTGFAPSWTSLDWKKVWECFWESKREKQAWLCLLDSYSGAFLKEFFKPLLIFLIFTLMLNSFCRKRCFTFALELSLQFYGISHSNYVDMTCLHCLVSYILNMIFLEIYF